MKQGWSLKIGMLLCILLLFGIVTEKEVYAEETLYPVTVINGMGSGSYAKDSLVTVIALPISGYIFNGWTAEGVTLPDPNNMTTQFKMPAGPVTITANFLYTNDNKDDATNVELTVNPDGTTSKITNTSNKDSKGNKFTIGEELIMRGDGTTLKGKKTVTVNCADGTIIKITANKAMNGITQSAEAEIHCAVQSTGKVNSVNEACCDASKDLLDTALQKADAGSAISLKVYLPKKGLQGLTSAPLKLTFEVPQIFGRSFTLEKLILPKETINLMKKAKKNILVELSEKGTDVLWDFNGNLLAKSNTKVTDMNLKVRISDTLPEPAKTAGLTGVAVTTDQKGTFPATARLWVKVAAAKDSSETYYMYAYESTSKKYRKLPLNVYKTDKEGYVYLAVRTGETYLLLKQTPMQSSVISFFSQITVKGSYTLKKGKSGSAVPTFPVVLRPVTSFHGSIDDPAVKEVKVTYRSSKPKVVSVNSEGVLKAKKKGKSTITITVSLKDGSSKKYQQKVTVK